MIQDYKAEWIQNQTTLKLNDPDQGMHLLGMSGLGMPAYTRFSESSPLQEGITDTGYRLQERMISIILGFNGKDLAGYYQRREELIRLWRPDITPGILRITLPTGKVREIQGHLLNGLEFSDSDRSFVTQKTSLVVRCPDPTFYDPEPVYNDFGMSGGGSDSLSIPMTVPMFVGASSFDTTKIIPYTGTDKTYPQIIISGPVTDLVIENLTTGDKLDFNGVTIVNGDTYTIDLRPGFKTVVDSSGNNKIADLTADSDISTFSLQPHPIAQNGANELQVSGTSTSATTNVSLLYYIRLLGI